LAPKDRKKISRGGVPPFSIIPSFVSFLIPFDKSFNPFLHIDVGLISQHSLRFCYISIGNGNISWLRFQQFNLGLLPQSFLNQSDQVVQRGSLGFSEVMDLKTPVALDDSLEVSSGLFSLENGGPFDIVRVSDHSVG